MDARLRRKILYFALYLSEGAPIGFLWFALPTRLRSSDIPIEEITSFVALLVIPWTFKFVWAPAVDLLRGRWWGIRHTAVTAQLAMVFTLLPLLYFSEPAQFQVLKFFLLAHAFFAATQDVAIDALCIASTPVQERGGINAWMQAGMLLGRAVMGGGALVLTQYLGPQTVVWMLILLTGFSALLLTFSFDERQMPDDSTVVQNMPKGQLRLQQEFSAEQHTSSSQLINQLFATATQSGFWLGILFALIAGAGFKSLEVYYGPFLIDRGMSEETIGWFSMGPMILMMLGGAMYGGRLADRASPHRICKISLFGMAGLMGCLALSDLMSPVAGWWHCLLLTGISFGIGAFTVSMYALLMNLARQRFAATQFSCFMGAVNGCEAWSGWLSGKLITAWDYPAAMLVLGAMSLTALPLLSWMKQTGD